MNATHPTANFLRRHRRRARGTRLVWSLMITLGTAAFMGAAHLGWTAYGIEWALIPIAIAGMLLAGWFQRAPRLTPRQLAHDLDTRWALRARLETAVELAGNESPLARVQRDDATQNLAGKNPPGALLWFTGLLAVAAVLSLLSIEGTALAVRAFRTPPPPKAVAEAEKSTPLASPPTPPEFHAAIEWKSPESEIKATAIEEVPLVAIGESDTGFRSVSLEMVVNGDRELSRPLDESTIAAGTTPGTHEFTPSLYLDELDVKVGDIVSYRLVAELNAPVKQMVTSPLQFVEIRKTQRDSELKGAISPVAVLLFELKAQQLQLLKQNFSLAQLAAGAASDPSWNDENTRVAAEQDVLADRMDELLKLFRAGRVPGAMIDQAEEAQSLMREAGKEIASKANEPATKTQARALAIITDLATNIRKALSGPTAPVADPFKDEQTFKLVPRSETPAGELEQLALRQQKNNEQLGSAGGDPKTEQNAIVRDAERIGHGASLDPLTKPALDAGTAAAAEAARQLAQGDTAAARVPAAAAQRAFEQAVAAQDNAGRAAAVADLDQLRRTLNTASRANAAERAQQLAQVRDVLRAAATEQQRAGSADAARELAQLAELARATKPTPERTRELAVAAAQVQVGLMPRAAAVNRAVRLLGRTGQPGTGNDSGESALGDVEIASQEAQWISGDAQTIDLARQVATQADTLQRAGDRAPSREATENATKLAAALGRGRGGRDELVRRFNPADVDPAYRAAVETYFERLSRDARPAARAPGK